MNISLKIQFILILVLTGFTLQGQESIKLFNPTDLQKFGDGGLYVELNKSAIDDIKNCQKSIKVELPTQGGEMTFNIYPAQLFADGFEVKNQKGKVRKVDTQTHLSGELLGGKDGFATLSLERKNKTFSDWIGATSSYELTATIVCEQGVFSIVPHKQNIYQVLRDYHNEPFQCGDKNGHLDEFDFQQRGFTGFTESSANDVCSKIGISFVADYDFYQKRNSSVQLVTDYITNLFANVQKIYSRDGIEVEIKDITVFEKPDNFDSGSSIRALNSFATWITQNPPKGDVAHLLSPKGQGKGGVAYVDILCRAADRYQIGYSNIRLSYQDFPNYSWDVMVVTHELGHNFGSPHTQSCRWVRNGLQNQSIDGCYAPEGNCARGPIPQDGGTVMSYCHLQSVGINLLKGFGEQPSALIRQRIQAATCLQDGTCGDDDDDGGDDGIKTDLAFRRASVTQDVSKVRASVQISNGAKAVSDVRVQFRLSKVRSRWNDADYSFGFVNVDIDANKDYSFSLVKTYSNIGLPDGAYYMSAKVDSENAVIETNETNNIYYFDTPISIGEQDYCKSAARFTFWDWIDKTTIGNYTNSQAKNVGYSLTKTSYEMRQGEVLDYFFDIAHRTTRPTKVYLSVWIDWNGNKVFEESEKIVSDDGKNEFKGVFQIPDVAKLGVTRMRIMLGKSLQDVQNPCLSYNWGQVKDFEFVIIANSDTSPRFTTECWESTSSVTLDFVSPENPEPHENGGFYTLQYKKQFQEWSQAVTTQPIQSSSSYLMKGLEGSVIYDVRVKSVKDGQSSAWSKTAQIQARDFCTNIKIVE